MPRPWTLCAASLLLAFAAAPLTLHAGKEGADKKEVKKEGKAVGKKEEKKAVLLPPREGKSETIKLFNGENLDGWEGAVKFFSVKDGMIVAKNSDPVKVSVYLVTKRKFTDFRLTLEAELAVSEMHSGVAFWGKLAPDKGDPNTYLGHLVMFPSPWNIYDLHRRNKTLVAKDLGPKHGKQKGWNQVEILAQGNRIRVAINGHQTMDYVEPNPDFIFEAPIGLQLHSNKVPQEVRFKGLVLETFPKEDRLITVKDAGK